LSCVDLDCSNISGARVFGTCCKYLGDALGCFVVFTLFICCLLVIFSVNIIVIIVSLNGHTTKVQTKFVVDLLLLFGRGLVPLEPIFLSVADTKFGLHVQIAANSVFY
jgi:hypothetical protein